MRIVLMAAILAHHYVMNSGVTDLFSLSGAPARTVFLQLWGLWGKGAINGFVMVTGYFMCTSRITLRRFLKLYLQVVFYWTVWTLAPVVFGQADFSLGQLIATWIMWPAKAGASGNFVRSFLLFYLLIPFWNLLVEKLGKDGLRNALGFLLTTYVGVGTVFNNEVLFNEVFWFGVLFLLAAYLRLYASGWSNNFALSRRLLVLSIALSIASVVLLNVTRHGWTYFVRFPSRICAFLFGVSAFLFFKNLRIPHSNGINTVASATFGVLLFHANAFMRQFLWRGVLNVSVAFSQHLPFLVFHAVLSLLLVFVAGSAFDMVRIRLLEQPLFAWYDRHEETAEVTIEKWWSRARMAFAGLWRSIANGVDDQ